jgi:hypothetical protein
MIDKMTFIWTERAIDIHFSAIYENKRNLIFSINKEINFSIKQIKKNEKNNPNIIINQMKPSQFKTSQNFFKAINNTTSSSFNKTFSSTLQFKTTSFTIKGKEQTENNYNKTLENNYINTQSNSNEIFNKTQSSFYKEKKYYIESKDLQNNINDDSNIKISHRNQLLNYLPLKSHSQIKEKSVLKLNDFNTDISEIEIQYQNIKNDLIELNPALKINPNLREQFFKNISEGNEEKYLFYKNLYQLINSSDIKIKQLQKKNLQPKRYLMNNINKAIKNNPPIPGSTLYNKIWRDLQIKKKPRLFTDTSKLTNKSSSNIKLKRNNSFNF